jgi:DNA-binding GntR family transcriptional regulator
MSPDDVSVPAAEPLFAQAPQFRPLRNDAYEALREAILLGRLRPGERVVEAEIARQMGISRGPIREAVRQLEQEHLVEYHPRRGVVVARLTREAVQDTYAVRAELDGFAARLSAVQITDEQLGQLDGLIAAMRLQATEGDSDGLLHTDVEFHRCICTMAGNRVLLRAWSSLGPYAWTLFSGIQVRGYSLGDLAERHVPIADALRARDPVRAERTAKEHTLEIARNVLDHLDHNEPTFSAGALQQIPSTR